MGKKMKLLPFLSPFKTKKGERHSWQWPSCKHTKTLSFRAGGDMYKTVNSAFLNLSSSSDDDVFNITGSSESATFSAAADANSSEDPIVQSLEMIINGAQSERLFFDEPGGTRSILFNNENKKKKEEVDDGLRKVNKGGGSVVMAMESEDPYGDFRRSMEEMVESHHGLKDWGYLEEMLSWYLRVNRKINHVFVVGAFVDLVVARASSSSSDTIFSSADADADASSSLSSPLSPLSPPLVVQQKHTYQNDNINMVIS